VIVLILSKVSDRIRGRITRWLVEVSRGVFVGNVTATVRDQLWDAVRGAVGTGSCTLVQEARNEQGFVVWTAGNADRRPVDFDGLTLVAKITASGASSRTMTPGNLPEAG
jgi:CRISPR-associated protein Cas2